MAPTDAAVKQSTEFQMGGPKGAVFFSLFFTFLTLFVADKCQSGQWDFFRMPSFSTTVSDYYDSTTLEILLAWVGLQCLLYTLPIGGKVVSGLQLINGGPPVEYRINALFCLIINLVLVQVMYHLGLPVTRVFDSFIQFVISGVIMSLALSVILYIKGSFSSDYQLNPSAQTGNLIYNWFMGRELNPRIGFVDLKYVAFRSGIIGWIVMNHISLLNDIKHGELSPTLILVCTMQFLYVADYFWFEEGILVSRDIVHEGLGYNILVQFLMIPFTFCVQTRYIQMMKITNSWHFLLIFAFFNLTGYYIYRSSNSQKNEFRKNPNNPAFKRFKTLQTSKGKQLLVSGWWGICRHPNYFGDLIISFSYAFPTGFNHFMPYLNPSTLVLLLIDREKRDNQHCKEKYGDDWNKYCELVKYKIIPGIY